jgi:hypothetical protein
MNNLAENNIDIDKIFPQIQNAFILKNNKGLERQNAMTCQLRIPVRKKLNSERPDAPKKLSSLQLATPVKRKNFLKCPGAPVKRGRVILEYVE